MENKGSALPPTSSKPIELTSPRTSSDSFTVLATAAIFFGLGFVIAYLIFGGSGGNASNSDVQEAVLATFEALTPPPPTPIPVDLTLTDYNPSLGPEDAPVTIVEFSDFTCGFCGRFHRETLQPLMERYDGMVRFVYRYFPRFEEAVPLSVAALCAGEQDKFWEYSDMLWNNQIIEEPLNLDSLTLATLAESAGLDMEQYNACFISPDTNNMIIADYQTGRGFGVGGTPTFYINGEPFVGAQPIELFIAHIDELLVEQGITPPSGAAG